MSGTASLASVTVVLVHGAWADGSSWSKIIPLLQEKGISVAVQNPVMSLAEDAAATRRALARVKGPVVLVGHSWLISKQNQRLARFGNLVSLFQDK